MSEACRWRPTAEPAVAKLRAAMLQRARRYFDRAEVLEVDTPALSAAAVSDPQIESLPVTLQLDSSRPYYLHTSPEYCMKRLLCAGYPDIYQICKVFRDNEAGRLHQPEFTMIEWYRLGFGLDEIVQDSLNLIRQMIDSPDLHRPAVRLSYRDAFRKYLSCDPFECTIKDLAPIVTTDNSLQDSLGEDIDAWLDLALAQKIAPEFAGNRFTVLHHYPISQGALARQCPADKRVSDRFEVFLGPHELANGYVELTDALQLKQRFERDQSLRASRDQTLRPLDTDLIDAIDAGLPDCAGVALGFDRLAMLCAGIDDVRQVQSFAFVE